VTSGTHNRTSNRTHARTYNTRTKEKKKKAETKIGEHERQSERQRSPPPMAAHDEHYDAKTFLMGSIKPANRARWKSMGGVENAFRTVRVEPGMLKDLLATALPTLVALLPDSVTDRATTAMPDVKAKRIDWIADLLRKHAQAITVPVRSSSSSRTHPIPKAPVFGVPYPDPPASFVRTNGAVKPPTTTTKSPTHDDGEGSDDDDSDYDDGRKKEKTGTNGAGRTKDKGAAHPAPVTARTTPPSRSSSSYSPSPATSAAPGPAQSSYAGVSHAMHERAERELSLLSRQLIDGTYSGRFSRKNPVPRYYTYIILDPRAYHGAVPTFDQFLGAMFYVGKGTKERDVGYYDEAESSHDLQKQPNPKIAWINRLWESGRGYVLERSVTCVDELASLAYEHALIHLLTSPTSQGGLGRHLWMQGGTCQCIQRPVTNSPNATSLCLANQIGGSDVLMADLGWDQSDVLKLAREILLSTYHRLILARSFHRELRHPKVYHPPTAQAPHRNTHPNSSSNGRRRKK